MARVIRIGVGGGVRLEPACVLSNRIGEQQEAREPGRHVGGHGRLVARVFCVQAPSRSASTSAAVHRRRIFPFIAISLEAHQVRQRVLVHGVAKIEPDAGSTAFCTTTARGARDVQSVSLANARL